MENRLSQIIKSLPPWSKPVAVPVCVLIIIILIVWMRRPTPEPGEIVKQYVNDISAGRCSAAYDLVSDYARTYFLEYGTYKDFKKNVCDRSINKYEVLRVYRIDDTVEGVNEAVVYIRLRYRASWMTTEQDRPMKFNLSRKGKRWSLDGPFLEL